MYTYGPQVLNTDWIQLDRVVHIILAWIHFTVKIQNTTKHRLLAIFMVDKRFAAEIRVRKKFWTKNFWMKKFWKKLKKVFKTIFLIDLRSSPQVALSRHCAPRTLPTLSLSLSCILAIPNEIFWLSFKKRRKLTLHSTNDYRIQFINHYIMNIVIKWSYFHFSLTHFQSHPKS